MSNPTTIKEASSHWPNLSGQAYINAANFIRKYLAPLGVIDPASRAKLYPAHLMHAIYAVYSIKGGTPRHAEEILANLLTSTEDHTQYKTKESPNAWCVVDQKGNVIARYYKDPKCAAISHCDSFNTSL